MLSHADNEIVTRTGPGTPMGNVMRRYWVPALMSSEVPEPDCAPVRVQLLGEKLVAFKDTNGKIGLVEEFCPHRRASLFLGRNEACGLRCVYHGWKFDVEGNSPPKLGTANPAKKGVTATASPDIEIDLNKWAGKGDIRIRGWADGSAGVAGYIEHRETVLHLG